MVELEQGCLFYMGQIYQVPLHRLSYVHLPSPSQYVLDLVYMNLMSPRHLDWDHKLKTIQVHGLDLVPIYIFYQGLSPGLGSTHLWP